MRALLIILLVLAGVPSWSGDERLPLFDGVPDITAQRVPLSRTRPALRRLGALTYLGGVALGSRDWAFGGFSALAVRDGRFLLLSDGGLTIDFQMGADLIPRDVRAGALPAGPGTGWQKRDRDSESLSVDPTTGDLLVGFERYNGVWRYDGGLRRAIRRRAPRAMARWPRNGGAEAMARLPDGRVVILSEDADAPGGGKRGLIFPGDPTDPRAEPAAFRMMVPDGYYPTDAAALPDGRLLVLTRAFGVPALFTAKLLLVDAGALSPGRAVSGRTIATFAGDILHDNFEGLAVTRDGADTILWLLSDDNGPSLIQRTLLLKFRLDLPPPGQRKRRPGD